MKNTKHILSHDRLSWSIDKVEISFNKLSYGTKEWSKSYDPEEKVRLHFGLKGRYDFKMKELEGLFELSGHHNNIIYSKGLTLEVLNHSKQIHTFGINVNKAFFMDLCKDQDENLLGQFTKKIEAGKNALLSPTWQTNNFKIQHVIDEIIHCPYHKKLKDLFLLSKSLELMVLQIASYSKAPTHQTIKTEKDKRKILAALDVLKESIENPPTISELSRQVGVNEFKLKKGFKELFNTTIFGWVHQQRMTLAKRLLLNTQKSSKEIAYEIGYSSPQHFSKAFKKEFGQTPNNMRINPDYTI